MARVRSPFALNVKEARLAVIGLGYVGLPIAVSFARQHDVVGFDIDPVRIAALQAGSDATGEVDRADLIGSKGLKFTTDPEDIRDCDVYIVTVPTPVDASKRPYLEPLLSASETVGGVISTGDVVIFESTVYPGATEEECVPLIGRVSGLRFNQDFFAGYSPERINPGDRTRGIGDIVKVTSGSTPDAAAFVDALYARIIPAGTHLAPSIRVAEAAKVIENTQRDLNIALVNELAVIFERMGLDTLDVLAAAGTKWNFQPFRPGLVGGHCIGVDPYYLTHKAQALGYDPQIILSGRRINDGMGVWVACLLVRRLIDADCRIKGARVLVLGLAFKENVPDLRNTKVIDLVKELATFGVLVDVSDPIVNPVEAQEAFGIALIEPQIGLYDAVVLAVPHRQILAAGEEAIAALAKAGGVILDLKGVLPRDMGALRI
ncbi:MAG: nucleotide sugar dehydrogenase [Pseudomonadota bacterium]